MREQLEAALAPGANNWQPRLYVIGRLCERFHCLPSALEQEPIDIIKINKLLDMGDELLEKYYGNGR